MNSTSFAELGGNVARVVGGSVRVGWPGAPGCTITGVEAPDCWAQTGNENETASVPVAISPLRAATLITDLSVALQLKREDFIALETQ